MKIDIFLDKHLNIKAENKLLKFFVVLIGIIQIVNIAWNYSITKSTKTIIIPSGLTSKLEISSNEMSEETIKQYTRYILGLVANYSPATVRSQFDELLTFYHPDSFAEAKVTLYSLAEDIEKAKVSSSFYIQKITLDSSKHTVEVSGTKRQYANEIKLKDKNETYLIEYTINNGKFMIRKIYLKETDEGDE